MGIKAHFGFFVLVAMFIFLNWCFRNDLREKFHWGHSISGALIVTAIAEAFGWAVYWFFFV